MPSSWFPKVILGDPKIIGGGPKLLGGGPQKSRGGYKNWGGYLLPVGLDVVGASEEFDFAGAGGKSFDHPVDLVRFVAGGTDLGRGFGFFFFLGGTHPKTF